MDYNLVQKLLNLTPLHYSMNNVDLNDRGYTNLIDKTRLTEQEVVSNGKSFDLIVSKDGFFKDLENLAKIIPPNTNGLALSLGKSVIGKDGEEHFPAFPVIIKN